jgi:hypothetical protein
VDATSRARTHRSPQPDQLEVAGLRRLEEQEGGTQMKVRRIAYTLAWLIALALAVGASWRG